MKAILFALIFLIPPISADIVVDELKGDVRVRFGKKFTYVKLRKGDQLSHGDQIRTKEGGLVHIKFHDESTILIKEHALFKIYDSKKKTQIDFSHKHGGQAEFLVGVHQKFKKKKKTFQIKTPATVVGVRGTIFWGLSDKHLNSTYASFENEIAVKAQGVTKILKPGKKIVVLFGQAPGDSVDANIPLDYIDTFNVNGSAQGIKQQLSQ